MAQAVIEDKIVDSRACVARALLGGRAADALFVAMERARFSSPYPRSASTAPPDGRTRSGDHYLDHAFVRGLDVTDATVLTTIESSDHQALSFAVRVPPEKRFTLDARGSLSSSR